MKANLRIANEANITENMLTSGLTMRECIFKDNNQNHIQNKSEFIKIRYTIKQGDQKRLNKRGVLKVYKVDQLIEIPVTSLLGKWKKTHVGVTVFKLNEEWQIEGRQVQLIINSQMPFIAIIKTLILKYKPLYIMEKLGDRRMSEDNVLKDA